MPESVIDLGKKVKAKFPGQYDDLADDQLGRMVKTKHPGDYDDFTDITPGMERLGGVPPGPAPRELPGGLEKFPEFEHGNTRLGTAAHVLASPVTGLLGAPGQFKDWFTRHNVGMGGGGFLTEEPITTAYGNAVAALATPEAKATGGSYSGRSPEPTSSAPTLGERLSSPQAKAFAVKSIKAIPVAGKAITRAGEAAKAGLDWKNMEAPQRYTTPTPEMMDPYNNPRGFASGLPSPPGALPTGPIEVMRQGVGAGPEVNAGVPRPAPRPQTSAPLVDQYGKVAGSADPYRPGGLPQIPDAPPRAQGVGAGPELDAGVPRSAPESKLTKGKTTQPATTKPATGPVMTPEMMDAVSKAAAERHAATMRTTQEAVKPNGEPLKSNAEKLQEEVAAKNNLTHAEGDTVLLKREDLPLHYAEHRAKVGDLGALRTFAKDLKVATRLKALGITPEQWQAMDLDTQNGHITATETGKTYKTGKYAGKPTKFDKLEVTPRDPETNPSRPAAIGVQHIYETLRGLYR